MIVKTDKGKTVCSFESFATQEPAIRKLREDFRAGKIDDAQVLTKVRTMFGVSRLSKDWDAVVGTLTDTAAISKWDAWIDGKPLEYRKLYYSPEVVAACVMGDE